jgi:glycosyltransferase involved in cell wall biosynthesis
MKVLVLGIRGLPNVEGGVETHAEFLYPLLASLRCEIEILVRTPFSPPGQRSFGSIKLTRIWSPRTPGLEALVHSILGVLYAAIVRPDILHIHAIGPAIVTPIARLFGLKVIVTNHGPDYDRDKWGPIARRVLHLGERVGMRHSNARIAISPVIAEIIKSRYDRDSQVIPNGVKVHDTNPGIDKLSVYGLLPGRYFLHVGRMVPEKRQLALIAAYRSICPTDWKLVIAGRLGDDAYSRAVKNAAGKAGVILTGFVKGSALEQLYSNAGAFVLPSSHEGLPIAMLEALSHGLPVLATDIPANLAVGLDPGSYFPLDNAAELERELRRLIATPQSEAARSERKSWTAERYDWNRIAEQTYQLYESVIQSKRN